MLAAETAWKINVPGSVMLDPMAKATRMTEAIARYATNHLNSDEKTPSLFFVQRLSWTGKLVAPMIIRIVKMEIEEIFRSFVKSDV